MTSYNFIRSLYRRARHLPIIGPFVEALRYRRFPVHSGPGRRYAEQQNMLEAHGHALAGLRQGLARIEDEQHNLGEAHEQAFVGLRQGFARIESELYAQVHRINLAIDKQRDDTNQRLEFVRQEMLFEFRYGLQAPAKEKTPARILRPEKLATQKRIGKVRLNVGCGHKPDTERINVDMRELPHVDIVATVEGLPFATGEVHEIYSAHLLEHFPHEYLSRQLLPLWCGLLASGGELRAVVPDGAAMLEAYARQEISFPDLRLIMYGGQEYEGDFHHTMFTPESLAELFASQGLENIRIEAMKRRNGLCYECEVAGFKP